MVRTQILLADHQHVVLKELAQAEGVSLSSLVRQAVGRLLVERRRGDKGRAAALLGAFEADRTDVSANHDRYLWDEDLS